jgi:porin
MRINSTALIGVSLLAFTLPAPAHAAETSSEEAAEGIAEASDRAPEPQTEPPPAPPAPNTGKGPEPSVKARLVVSQFVDMPVAGDAANTLRYSGRADAYINVGGSNFGLDDSWQLNFRPEFTWGETSNGTVGLIPNNTALFRPEGAGDFDLGINVKKTWSDGTNLTVGKINSLDLVGTLPIVGSDGHYGFQNLGLAFPPTAVIPNTWIGALFEAPRDDWIYRVWVYDPDSQYERTGFETAFESGVAFLGAATKIARIDNKPGFYTVAVVGSTRTGPAVDILPGALTPPPNGNFGNARGELALQLSAYQFISMNKRQRGKGIGIVARLQGSLGDPTFLDYSGYFGIAGNPAKRPQDRFGLAYFHYSLTDELVDDIAFRLGVEDEQGVEAFYTLGLNGVAKGFELTANVQVVDSAIAFRDVGVIGGLRLTAGF